MQSHKHTKSTYQFIWKLERFVCEIVSHKLCTSIVVIQLFVFKVGRS